MSEAIAAIPPQQRDPLSAPTTSSLEIVGEALSMLRQSLSRHWDVWLVAIIFFTGTNIVDIVFASPVNPLHSPLAVASLIVRIVAAVWVTVAALRTFADRGAVWAVDLSSLRSTGALAASIAVLMILLLILSYFITNPIIALMIRDPHTAHMARLIVVGLWLLGFGIVTVRLSPWIAALAIGDRSIGLVAAWKGMRGATLAAIGALIWTAPVPMTHLVLTAQAQYLTGTPQLVLVVIDGFVSVLQVLLGMAIAVPLYRFVANNLPRK